LLVPSFACPRRASSGIGAHTPSRAATRHPAADERKPAHSAPRTDCTSHRACVITRSAPPSRRTADISPNLFLESDARA